MSDKPKKKFSRKQLRASQGMIPQISKTNVYASQAGSTCFGAVRHGKDIVADDINQESHGQLTQQAATNIYASQKGSTCFGAVRHGRDIVADDADQDGQGLLTQQAKTNIYANQSGSTCFGAVRHGGDIKVTELYDEDDGEFPTDDEDEPPCKPVGRRAARDSVQEERNVVKDEGEAEEPVETVEEEEEPAGEEE